MKGTVAWFSNRRGYGFINRDDNERDVFVYYSNVQMDGYKTLKPGQKVEFDIEMIENKGPNAVNVQMLE